MKLIMGDCLEVMKDIPDGSVDMVLADPPYGTTACKWDSIIPLEPMWEQLNRVIKPDGAIVIFGSEPFSSILRMSDIKNYKYDWVWEKNPVGFLNAKKMPLKSIENILCFYKTLPTYNPQGLVSVEKKIKTNGKSKEFKTGKGLATHNGGRLTGTYTTEHTNYPRQVLSFNKSNSKSVHPTQKPVALMEYLIKTYTNEGETVLDFAMGSGTTGVACKNLNRNFIGIELDKDYFEMAKKRIDILNTKGE